MATKLREYLADPFLARLYDEIKEVGPLKSIMLDITHDCNIRCTGCYFFENNMDQAKAPQDEALFDAFIEQELARGTNYITVLGGEPSLKLDRLKKLNDNFWTICSTNGLRKIPHEGFETMPFALSVWGGHELDRELRGSGKIDVFRKALDNYKDDKRAFFYYTATAGNAHEIMEVSEECIANGNYILFNYYSDIANTGGSVDHRQGFAQVRHEIDRVIDRFPDKVFTTSYLNQVVTTGTLYDERWGYNVCTSFSSEHHSSTQRIQNSKPYNTHFRAYNPDLSLRTCCIRDTTDDCSTCFDTWSHLSWIMLNMKKHLGSKEEFTNWLTTMYLMYLITKLVDFDRGSSYLPEIHARQKYLRG